MNGLPVAFVVGVFVAGVAIGALLLFGFAAWYFTRRGHAVRVLLGILEAQPTAVQCADCGSTHVHVADWVRAHL